MNIKEILEKLKTWWRQRSCRHVFNPKDMMTRNEAGIIKWPCSKCKKVFTAEYGLKILENGKCVGSWFKEEQ